MFPQSPGQACGLLCRASAPATVPAAPAGRQAGAGGAATSQGGSLEDVSLKSLAPQGSRGLDNAALRAHLTGSARRAASTSAAATVREDEQGVQHAPASTYVCLCTVAIKGSARVLQTGSMQLQRWRDIPFCSQLQLQLIAQLQALRE